MRTDGGKTCRGIPSSTRRWYNTKKKKKCDIEQKLDTLNFINGKNDPL